jgi:hypothetical protein
MLETSRSGARDQASHEPKRTTGPVRAERRLDDRIGPVTAAVAAVAWILLTWVSVAVQPPPADPAAAPDGLALLISSVWTILLFASIAGLGLRQRWGLVTTFGGGALMVGASLYCYTAGHTGVWLATQLVAGAGLAATGAVLARNA